MEDAEDILEYKIGETVSNTVDKANHNMMSIKNQFRQLQQDIDHKIRTVKDIPDDLRKNQYIFLEEKEGEKQNG